MHKWIGVLLAGSLWIGISPIIAATQLQPLPHPSVQATSSLGAIPDGQVPAPHRPKRTASGHTPLVLDQYEAGTRLFGTPGGCNGDIYAAAVADNGIVYLGGIFTACEDVEAINVVAYDPVARQFSPLRGPQGNGASGPVYSLLVVGSDLYVGGNFNQFAGRGANYIELAGFAYAPNLARWDGGDSHALGQGTNSLVFAMVTDGQSIYAAGAFDQAGGQPASRVAR